MTTVCALTTENGRVIMGADSHAILFDRPLPGRVKIDEFIVADSSPNPGNPSFLLGYSGHGALSDILRDQMRVLTVPAPDADPQPWAAGMAQRITDLARSAGILEDDRLDGNVLLGWSGRLWTIYTAGAHQHTENVAAIGSGQSAALGALLAMSTWPRTIGQDETAEDAVRQAVTIACTLDAYSGGTPVVKSIPHSTD